MGYQLEGSLLEVCTCNTLCPCWVGDDPDGGTCDGVLSWHIEKGKVNDVDVSDLTLTALVHIPGNILKGNWKAVVYVDERADSRQQEALLNVWTGKLGGPVADLAKLVGEVLGVERVPVHFEVHDGKGSLRVGSNIQAELAPFMGATGKPTTLQDSIFTTIPGSPAYVSKASKYRADVAKYGFDVDLNDHNAVQGQFRFAG